MIADSYEVAGVVHAVDEAASVHFDEVIAKLRSVRTLAQDNGGLSEFDALALVDSMISFLGQADVVFHFLHTEIEALAAEHE